MSNLHLSENEFICSFLRNGIGFNKRERRGRHLQMGESIGTDWRKKVEARGAEIKTSPKSLLCPRFNSSL